MEVWYYVTFALAVILAAVFGYEFCRARTFKKFDGRFIIDEADEEGKAGVFLEGFYPSYEELMKRKYVIFKVENALANKNTESQKSQTL